MSMTKRKPKGLWKEMLNLSQKGVKLNNQIPVLYDIKKLKQKQKNK